MAIRQGGDGSVIVDRFKHGLRPAGLRRPLNSNNFPALALGQFLPRIDVRGELIAQRDDALPLLERKVRCGDSEAVTDRGDDGDILFGNTCQLCRLAAKFLGHAEEIRREEIPRLLFQPGAFHHRRADGVRERRHISAVEVMNLVRDRKQMPLGSDHAGQPSTPALAKTARVRTSGAIAVIGAI